MVKKKPVYGKPMYFVDDHVVYGSKVTAYFYVGDQIEEGDAFGDDELTRYVDDMGKEWHKGHMLAKSLGGDNNVYNMLPMKANVNNSTFKAVENYVHKLIEHLADIQNMLDIEPLHIEYTIERVSNSPITVNGYTFPGKFSYSIKILKEDGTNVDFIKLYKTLDNLGIKPNIKFSETLKVDE